ncbi:hypothetical protein GCM10018777_10860 [Streptomyces albogriseolus]|nr:hypothetical protein GCM10018777_10860 [Streptomyces viridodiastaticus]
MEDPREPLAYDDEWVVVLDDWVDGVTGTPDEVFAELKQGMGSMDTGGASGSGMEGHDMHNMGGMGEDAASPSPSPSSSSGGMSSRFMLMGAESDLLGGDAGDVKYPYHLVNGRIPADPHVYTGKLGHKVRLRIINAGSDTAYRVALGGHRLTVTPTPTASRSSTSRWTPCSSVWANATTSWSPSATASSPWSPRPRARTPAAWLWSVRDPAAHRRRPYGRRNSTA